MIPRYSRPEMTHFWTEKFKFSTWLKIEILACEARAKDGEVPAKDLQTIKKKAKFSISRINELEKTLNHDVISFLTSVSENVGPAARHIHYGMTSSDILDTTLSYQMKCAGELLLSQLITFSESLKKKALEYKYTYCIGRTHGIHAEPTTMGLKFALWYEEIQRDITRVQAAIDNISVGMLSGAVGTFEHLDPKVEKYVCEHMGLRPAPVSTQIIQRDRHAEYMTTLAIVGSTLEKIATEIRHLQKTEVLEAEEFFGKGQKGSSAMPHKRNPIICERIAGMARILRGNSLAAMENVTLWHERDISHSSVERVIVPDSTIILNYMLHLATRLIDQLIIYPENMEKNLFLTRGLIFSQRVLLKLTEKGLSREASYAAVQEAAMKVWRDTNLNLRSELQKSAVIKKNITPKEMNALFDIKASLKHIDDIFARTVLKA